MKIRLAKKIMKHKCTFLDLEEKYKKKGYNVKWLLAMANSFLVFSKILRIFSQQTGRRCKDEEENIDPHRQQAMVRHDCGRKKE